MKMGFKVLKFCNICCIIAVLGKYSHTIKNKLEEIKMFKKVMSVALAAAMVASVGAVAVNAAEVEDVAVAAEDSSAVGADSSSEATGAASTIYFDAESSGWANYKTIYCHIWRADGEGEWPQWQTRKERCTKEEDGRYSYDLTKTGNEIKSSDGNLYCVIFSADTGVQTYNTIMSGSCIGDTCYVTGETVENPEDSEKTAQVAAWKNNPSCGPQRVITSTAKVVGTALAEGTTDVTLMADYLIKYAADAGKLEKTQSLIDQLKISPLDVMASVKYKEEEAVKAGSKSQDDADKELKAIQGVLKNCTDPTKGGEKVDEEALNKTEAKNDAADNGSSSNNNSSSSSSSSNSNSVSSGAETTIFFVFAGVMLAAAGTMFLARRREN